MLLKMLKEKTTFTSDKPAFKIIYSTLSHVPWYLPEDDLSLVEDPYPATKGYLTTVDGILPEHLYTEEHMIRFLDDYVSLLKENDVYDNTRIIVVSDHCYHDSAMLNLAFGGIVAGPADLLAAQKYPGRPHSVLLFKDFDAKGNFSVSGKLMTSTDAYYLARKAISADDQETPPDEGLRKHFALPSWQIENYPEKYEYTEYQVTGSMFDPDNWEERR